MPSVVDVRFIVFTFLPHSDGLLSQGYPPKTKRLIRTKKKPQNSHPLLLPNS